MGKSWRKGAGKLARGGCMECQCNVCRDVE